MIYIIATQYRLAEQKCHELQVSPRDRTKVKVITRAENCRGINFDEENDTYHFLTVPEDWTINATYHLNQAWQYVLRSSRARRS